MHTYKIIFTIQVKCKSHIKENVTSISVLANSLEEVKEFIKHNVEIAYKYTISNLPI